MSDNPVYAHSQPVQDYIRACDALLKIVALSNEEAEVIEEMFGRIAVKFLNDETDQRAFEDAQTG
jgi:hypothetical protein